MITHFINGGIFGYSFIDMISNNSNSNRHTFIVYDNYDCNKDSYSNVKNINDIEFNEINQLVISSDKIVVHGLFSYLVIDLLYKNPGILKNVIWVVWGGDIYSKKFQLLSIKSIINYCKKSYVSKRIGGIGVLVENDYDICKKKYKVVGDKYILKYYVSGFDELFAKCVEEKNYGKEDKCRVLVGNNASKSNQHIPAFKILSRFDIKNIKVYCPLSYGDLKYADKVIKKGYQSFGDNFIPIRDYMALSEYMKLLSTIDIAIFNNNRQQALGNIFYLLGFGAKVYLREDTSMWSFIKDHLGYTIFPMNSLCLNDLKPLDMDNQQKNYLISRDSLSEQNIFSIWEKIFTD